MVLKQYGREKTFAILKPSCRKELRNRKHSKQTPTLCFFAKVRLTFCKSAYSLSRRGGGIAEWILAFSRGRIPQTIRRAFDR
jgi:hypothetical protein